VPNTATSSDGSGLELFFRPRPTSAEFEGRAGFDEAAELVASGFDTAQPGRRNAKSKTANRMTTAQKQAAEVINGQKDLF
jgi:hypothetical protein